MARLLAFSFVVTGLFAGCGGQLFVLENQEVNTQPCSVFFSEGQCPDPLECCRGVCQASCDAGGCSCQPGEACVDDVCQTIDPLEACSFPDNLDGLCPYPDVCVGGTCVPISGTCGCEPGLACVDGECRAIHTGEECRVDNPAGLCVDGQVCIDGACVALENACTQSNPNGLCPSGASCTGGRCVDITRPCGPDALDGQCPSCQQCVAPGQCERLTCSAEAPSCACPNADEYCDDGTCKPFACGPSHLAGGCTEADQYCCSEGRCVDDGACCAPADCTLANTMCSSCNDMCINVGTCTCDDDCADHYKCDTGSFVCVRDLDCSENGDDDCEEEEYCDSANECRQDNTCLVQGDCDHQGLTGTFCASCQECLLPGECCEESDCIGRDTREGDSCTSAGVCYCSSENNCLKPPDCDTSPDCTPGYFCNGSKECELNADPCTANGASSCVEVGTATVWCCPTGETCCEQGERCSLGDDICIEDGRCRDDDDCYPGYFTCNTDITDEDKYTCVANTACTDSCATGTCSAAGGCIPDDGTCAHDDDCLDGEVCNALWQCEPAKGCGDQDFADVTKVPPNLLVVLDRSGSMNRCFNTCPSEQAECEAAPGCSWTGSACHDDCDALDQGDCALAAGECGWDYGYNDCRPATSRWVTAERAVSSVVSAWSDEIRFGVSLYPRPCTGECTNACYWTGICDSCGDTAGQGDVPVGPDAATAITTVISRSYCDNVTTSGVDSATSCTGDPECQAIDASWTCEGGFCDDLSTSGLDSATTCVVDSECSAVCGSCTCESGGFCDDPDDTGLPTGADRTSRTPCLSDVECQALNPPDTDNWVCTDSHPGGNTPTAPTLRAVEADRNSFGLPLDADPIDRNNYILLVTDGDANASGEDPLCELGSGHDDLVNCALDRLRQDPDDPVQSFVVGFAFGGSTDNLNCHAYYGGTSRCVTPEECSAITDPGICDGTLGCSYSGSCTGGIDADTCDNQSDLCYYPADDEAELVSALSDIVGSVSSCDFSIWPLPQWEDAVYVYLYYKCDTLSVPDGCNAAAPNCRIDGWSCVGEPVRVERDDPEDPNGNGWIYVDDQVKFQGDACTTVQEGGVVPIVILGCGTGE